MKICNQCNTHLTDLYMSCPNCGNTQLIYQQDNYNNNQQYNNYNNQQYVNMSNQTVKSNKINSFAIYSVLFAAGSFFFWEFLEYVSYGFAIAALVQISKTKEKGMIFAILAIILNVLMTIVEFQYYGYI